MKTLLQPYIMLIAIVPCMHEFYQTLLIILHCVVHYTCYLVPNGYAVSHIYVKLPILVYSIFLYQKQHLYSDSIYFSTINTYHNTKNFIITIMFIFITAIITYHNLPVNSRGLYRSRPQIMASEGSTNTVINTALR